jgi:hypothetical protein
MKHLLLVISLAFVACDNTGPLDKKDPKAIYLDTNLPGLKVVRDQLAGEYITCKKNIKRLQTVASSFKHTESKFRLQVKVDSLKMLQDQLKAQLDKIDTEVEHGIALKEINNVDGGGLRHSDINKLMIQSSACLKSARAANHSASTMIEVQSDQISPPKVIPVKRT